MYFYNSEIIADNEELIARLGRLGNVVEIAEQGSGMRIAKAGYDVWLDIDTGAIRTYLDKLIDQKAGRQSAIDRLESRLSQPGYAQKAPANIVEQSKAQLEDEKVLLAQIEAEIEAFTKLAGG
jgi:valyl-tRNA synthetase